jgi:hypothetical protein
MKATNFEARYRSTLGWRLIALSLSGMCYGGALFAQSVALDKFVGRDLWKKPLPETEQSRLDQLIGEVPKGGFAQAVPWHVWKTTADGQTRYVVLLGEREAIIPGNSYACVVLLDGQGIRMRSWSFQTGWRGTLDAASFEFSSNLRTDLIVLHTVPLINGRKITKEYFAIGHDSLRFVRMEDDQGALVQNEYVYPNFEIGIVPAANGPDQWADMLQSDDKADVLAALMFLGGRHVAESRRKFISEPKESKYAGLFEELLASPRIRESIEQLTKSEDECIRQAAVLAAREPRERILH